PVNGHADPNDRAALPVPPVPEGTNGFPGVASVPANPPTNGYHPPADAPVPPVAETDAYGQFQETMRQFLQMQERVLQAYFNQGPGPWALPDLSPAARAHEVVAKPAHAEERPAPTNGHAPHVSVGGQVANLPGVNRLVGNLPHRDQPVTGVPTPEALADLLIDIASQRTGYPGQMLHLDAHLPPA